jgi:hypothetical protein
MFWKKKKAPKDPEGGKTQMVEGGADRGGKTRVMFGPERDEDNPVCGWLVVLSGNQRGLDFRLDERKKTVGPTTEQDITIFDDFISAPHCSIRYEGGSFIVTDLGSSNKTFVNDERISEQELIDNDKIKIGKTELKFKCL